MEKEPTNLSCSYCGKSQREVRKLIAGPTVSICDECVKLCNDIIADEKDSKRPAESHPLPEKKERAKVSVTPRCSFCGKEQHEVQTLIAGPSVYVCDECVGLCNDIIADEIERWETARALKALPEGFRSLIAGILDRGMPAAERIRHFLDRQIMQNTRTPPDKLIWGSWGLAGDWRDLHRLLAEAIREESDSHDDDARVQVFRDASPEYRMALPEWASRIVERLSGTAEVLGVLARRLEEPGLEELRPSVDLACERLDEARELLLAGPPRPPLD